MPGKNDRDKCTPAHSGAKVLILLIWILHGDKIELWLFLNLYIYMYVCINTIPYNMLQGKSEQFICF